MLKEKGRSDLIVKFISKKELASGMLTEKKTTAMI